MRHIIPQEIKLAIRQRYAWPGGYPLFLLCDDGGCLCVDCGRKNWDLIARSIVNGDMDGWNVIAADINWEDDDLICDHCADDIDCAYPSEEN